MANATPRARVRAETTTTLVQPVARKRIIVPKPTNSMFDKDSELGATMALITKHRGEGVVRPAELLPKFKHIPTGVFSLDMACLGGFPEGAVTLGVGWEHSGKTTMGLRFLAHAQKKYPEMFALFVDVEGTYAPAWGAIHGIDNSRLILVQPGSGEEALDVAVAMMRSKEISAVMVDSLAGLVPLAVKDKSFEDAVVGKQALMISRFCAVMQSELNEQRKRGHRPAIYMVNQFRYKIGVMHGDPRTTPGGVAANYVATLRLEFKNKEEKGSDDNQRQLIDHNDHSFTMKKNKIGNGPREGEFLMVRNTDHVLGQGFIDDARTVVTWAKATGAITGGGSSWRIRGVDDKFPRLQEIADYFYSDLDFFDDFKRSLIEDFREKQGMERNYL